MTRPDLELDYRPQLPRRRDMGIGIVGTGAIVEVAHLPAYQKAGFRVAGVYDQDADRAAKTASRFQIERVYGDLEQLLTDPEVSIVDIATPPWDRKEMVQNAVAAGKHILCQKPLADTYPEAVEVVEIAEKGGVLLAVNQQMRWDPLIRASHLLLERGWMGDPFSVTIDVSIYTDWEAWTWLPKVETLDLMYHSIHYFDSLRFLLGLPERIYCTGSRYPGQPSRGESHTITVMEYPGPMRALVAVNHNNWTDDRHATFRIEGTEGLVTGTFGLLYNYPHGRPDTMSFSSRARYGQYRFDLRIADMWIPDAFVGPMASLMRAIEDGGTPETDGRDNLKTLQMVNAGYRSMAEARAVRPEEATA